jgi:hypothetical protein
VIPRETVRSNCQTCGQDLLCYGVDGGSAAGSFDKFAVLKHVPARTKVTRWDAVSAASRSVLTQ